MPSDLSASLEHRTLEVSRPQRHRGFLAHRFRQWTQTLDGPTILDSARNSWVGVGLAILVISLAAMYVPGASRFFSFRPWIVFAGYLPMFVASVVITVSHRKRREPTFAGWILITVGSAAVQLVGASLVSASEMPGAAAFGSLFVFAAAYHGFWFRVTPTEPFLAIGTACAGVVAILLNPDADHVALFATLTPAAVAAELIAGGHAKSQARHRAENERLRAALDAQILAQQEQEVRDLSLTLMEVLGANHDVRNAVTSARLVADSLAEYARDPTIFDATALRELTDDLQTSLNRIQALVEQTRSTGNELAALPRESVDALAIVESVLATMAVRFPDRELRCEASAATTIRVRGGELTLRRIVENLVSNACEGDGVRGASSVVVNLRRDRSGMGLELRVRDDGPGFPPAALSERIQPYSTTKESGTGLGLFTVQRLVRASDGSLTCANASEGGAVVTVVLPIAWESARER
jgi:signal transduction histidine kinase